ncbi:hypothetical protein [Streptomyces platensis]|uniref:hypothetical protein n=1 Tax=Streptomyces platensis TaxID=58346 RepID=UPI002E81D8B9|nr:hypothetical protein [Streptomyces platensis]WUB82603.1 hypothetical protein OG424_27425 [Streptomyces platensis]
MGDGFKTDVDELANFQKTLKQAESSLDEVRKSMKDTGSSDIGTKSLDDACNVFQEHWKYGVEQIHEKAKKLNEGLEKVNQNYREVEKALAAAFTKEEGKK